MPNVERLTSRDLARCAGVSQTTVSLVLRDAADGRVSLATQEHVRKVARELGYRPSMSARSLRSGRAHMLGLVIPNIEDPFFGAVVRGAQQAGTERGYTVAVIESSLPAYVQDAVAATRATLLDGLILHSPDRGQLQAAREIADRLVIIDGGPTRGVHWIKYDIAHGVQLAVQHLLERGHRRIAHVTGDVEKPTFTARAKNIQRVAGRRLVATLRASFDFDRGREALAQFLRDARVTALFCDTDSLAAMAAAAARSLRIRVPDELSLIAFNDTPLARALELTTIALPAARAGCLGAQMLLEIIEGGEPSHQILDVTLVQRGSTAAGSGTSRGAPRSSGGPLNRPDSVT